MDKLQDDLYCAVEYARQQGYSRIGLYGHCVGSLICLKARHPAIQTLVLAGAVTGAVPCRSYYLSDKHQQILDEKGMLSIRRSRSGSKVVIEKQLTDIIETLDSQALMESLPYPVLLIHGNGNWEEKLLGSISQKALTYLNPPSEMKLIPGAPHSFEGYTDTVACLTLEWLEQHLGVGTPVHEVVL
jgi:dienelactone hydrolase